MTPDPNSQPSPDEIDTMIDQEIDDRITRAANSIPLSDPFDSLARKEIDSQIESLPSSLPPPSSLAPASHVAETTWRDRQIRIQTIRVMILSGTSRQVICQFAANKWGVSNRQADRYIKEAREQLVKDSMLDRMSMVAEHIALRRDMRLRARQSGDLRAELVIAQDEARLLGLYNDQSTEEDWKKELAKRGIDVDQALRDVEEQLRRGRSAQIEGKEIIENDPDRDPEEGDS